MYSLCGIIQAVALLLFLTQPIFSEIIRFNDDGIIYEYDNSSDPLGRGGFGTVYKGIRVERNHTEIVAFKELRNDAWENELLENELLQEKNLSEILGQHDSFPTFYRYFPETNETRAVFVMERIGRTMASLWRDFRPFSSVTAMQVGLQMLDAVQWMHGIGLTHNDLHTGNIAFGYHNKSKIYLFDFSMVSTDKDSNTTDLLYLSQTLIGMIRRDINDEAYKRNDAFMEFELIAKKYHTINNDTFRKETFDSLRGILMSELDKHKNDVEYEKYDIGYIQDADDGMNLLRKLIGQNDTSAIENLIRSDQRLDIDARFGDISDYRPIHLAAEKGNTFVVHMLIEHGAEINSNGTHFDMSPLHYAAMRGNIDVVKILCKHGAAVNAVGSNEKTPLHWAAEKGKIDVIQVLIKNGVEINPKDNQGKVPLHYAAQNGKIELVQILIEHGAEINSKESNGSTPLHYAARIGNAGVARLLIEQGAEINAQCLDGSTPLCCAVKLVELTLARILIEHGAEIDVKCDGQTPLHVTASLGKAKHTQFLIEYGADITAEDSDGKTPLDLALETGYRDVIDILTEAEQRLADEI